jgi:hypothetical protein
MGVKTLHATSHFYLHPSPRKIRATRPAGLRGVPAIIVYDFGYIVPDFEYLNIRDKNKTPHPSRPLLPTPRTFTLS